MAQSNQDTVPQTVLNYGTRVNADLSFLKGRGKVMVANLNFVVIGLDDIPFIMFTTPKYSSETISPLVQKDVYGIKRLIFQPSFVHDELKDNYCTIPSWLSTFKEIDYLKLKNVEICNLLVLQSLPVRFLQLENIIIKPKDCQRVVNDIGKFKYLRGIVYDKTMPKEILEMLRKNSRYVLYSALNLTQMGLFENELNKSI